MTVAVTSQHELSRNVRTTKMHELKCARVRSRGASIVAVAATKEAVAEEAVDAVDDGEINESGLESSDANWASQRHHGPAHVSGAAYGRRGVGEVRTTNV